MDQCAGTADTQTAVLQDEVQGHDCINAQTVAGCVVSTRMRPVPPSRTPIGAMSRFQGTELMGFSFALEGNTHPMRETWGSPFGMLRHVGEALGGASADAPIGRAAVRLGWTRSQRTARRCQRSAGEHGQHADRP